jgi:hypothetical protein
MKTFFEGHFNGKRKGEREREQNVIYLIETLLPRNEFA